MEKTTAGLISRLEQKGLVAVSGDKEDKRIKYVALCSSNCSGTHYVRLASNS